MKRFKRLAVVLFSIITLGTSVLGLTSCDMLKDIFDKEGVKLKGEGIGRAVNVLTGDYTTIASGSTSIFNTKEFNVLKKRPDRNVVQQETEITYAESIENYMEKLSSKVTDKLGMEVSAGMDKVAKVTMGYDIKVSDEYEKKTYCATKSVFYDMDYYYIYGQVEIDGYNDLEKLRQIVKDSFKMDAQKVADGTMNAEAFIQKYGTHIVTAGIYGAAFNAHYEMISDAKTIDTTFKNDIEDTINATIGGSIYGVAFEEKITSGQSISKSELKSTSNERMQSTFKAKAKGGTATPPNKAPDNLDAFVENCNEWAKNLNDNYVLIDVPDNSLYFVWEFLGDEYQETKDILYDYFYATCDMNNQKLREKMGDFYSHFVTFDEETGTLDIDFSDMQTMEKADISSLIYKAEKDNSGIDFNDEEGTLKVYSMVKGQEVKKVVFRGNYQRKNSFGAKPTTKFSNLNIQFDEYWDKDIVVEFDSFAFEAPKGKNALDFSEVESKNITINVVNAASMRGGDGASYGEDGWIGINAPEKNITITGDNLKVIGGNGVNGISASGNGSDGGIAIIAENIIIDKTGALVVNGGNGGNGATGYVGSDGSGNNAPGSNGGNGGNGGNGASTVKCVSITISETSFVTLIAGNGGNGGAGGRGGNGTRDSAPWSNGNNKGGNGGNGGNGGFCSKVLIANSTAINTEIVLQEGTIGLGGVGGDGGNGGPGNTSFIAGSGGAGGFGGIGGLNGDGVTRASDGNVGQQGG